MSWHHRVWMYDRLNPTRGYDAALDHKTKLLETIRKLDLPINPLDDIINQVMAPRVKGKGVKGHRGSRTTTAAAISTTSTSSGTSVVPDFQSGPLSQQPYLMVLNPGYTGLPPPSWPTPGCMGPPPPPPPPISIPPPLCNSSLLVDSETPESSSTSPLSETASVPNSVTKKKIGS
nr:probable inactive serine/threonine-protein kinase slob2 [Arachis hypogaea]